MAGEKQKKFKDKLKEGLTKDAPNARISSLNTNFESFPKSSLFGISNELLEQDFSEPFLFVLSTFAHILNNKWGNSVQFHIETRKKSEKSIRDKITKQEEEVIKGKRNKVDIKDILAASIIVDFVADERDISKIKKYIGDSKEVLYEMQKRTENIDLLANIVKYFNKQLEIGPFFSIYDNEKTSYMNVEALKEAFNGDFYDTLLKYRDKSELENMPIIDLNQKILEILEKEKLEYVKQLKFYTERNSSDRKSKIQSRIAILNKVIDQIKAKITEKNVKHDDKEEYYMYMLILLNSLKSVEYEKCSVRGNKTDNNELNVTPEYSSIVSDFENILQVFITKELAENENEAFDGNGDVSLEDLKTLERWCAKLNAQMSDKLQQEILKDAISRLYILIPEVMNAFIDDKLDSKIFDNGYVADHSNILIEYSDSIIALEAQLKSSFRKKVSSIGSASHGGNGNKKSGRQEKQRDWDILPQYSKDDPNEIVILGQTFSPDELKSVISIVKSPDELKKQLKDNDLLNHYIDWIKKLDKVLPRYATIDIEKNNKNDQPIVVCTLHGIITNIEKYFGETNVRNQHKLVKNAIEIIKKFNLFNNYEKSICLSDKGYLKYVEKLKNDTTKNDTERN